MLYSFCYFVVFFHLLWLVHCASDDQNQNQKDPAGIDLTLRIGPPNVNSESHSNVEVTQVHPVQVANAKKVVKSKRSREQKVEDVDRVKRRRITNRLAQQRHRNRIKSGVCITCSLSCLKKDANHFPFFLCRHHQKRKATV